MSEATPRRAEERHGWWPGWIWSVPIAAIGLGIWLAVRSWTQTGPDIKVIFPVIADLRPGDTSVTFEGYKVGQVEAVRIESDLRHMRATLSIDPDMRGHLGRGTQFWIIGRTTSFAHLSDIKALISGVSIGIKPAPGHKQSVYHALANDPVLGFGTRGTPVTLHSGKLGSVQAGTPIYYLGENVGEVEHANMTGGDGFTITAFINAPFDRLVHDGTRFWRAGPIHLETGGGGPSVQFQSVPALIQGAIAFETPSGPVRGPVAAAGHDFKLYSGEDTARNAPDSQGVEYRAVFSSASGVPDVDAPVTLMGKRVGTVTHSALRYDPDKGTLDVVASFIIEPRHLTLANGASWTTPRTQMDDMMRHLIEQGLRAGLSQSPPLVGGQQIALRIVPGKPGTLGGGAVPEIPTSQGGGVSGVIADVNSVIDKVNEMPLPQIADNLRDISAHIAQLTNSPALASTLRQVDRSTANLQRVTAEMRRQVPPAIDALRGTVQEAQASLASAQDLLSARGTAANTPDSSALPQTLYEITRTARALRELSDFLDRHPSAVLTGRASSQ